MQALYRTDGDTAGLVLRVLLGVVIFPHGYDKVANFSGTMEAFAGMGIPSILTVLVILTEFLGSLALILGLFTRVAALGIGIIMVVAIAMVHWQYGLSMNWFGAQEGEGFEYHLLALAISLALLFRGGGLWSIDRNLARAR